MELAPIENRLILKVVDAEKTTASGLIIPDNVAGEKIKTALVIAAGKGTYEYGQLTPMTVKVGDTVIFNASYEQPIKNGEEEIYIIPETNILAIVLNVTK